MASEAPATGSSYRPLRARERRELFAIVSPRTSLLRTVVFFVFALTFYALSWSIGRRISSVLGVQLLALLPATILLVLLYARSGKWTGGPVFRQRVKEDLEAGVARRLLVIVSSAVEFEEVGDTGPTFIITTPTGDAILFSGQEFSRHKSKGFPWQTFELIDAPRSNIFLGLKRLGNPSPNVEKHPSLSYEQARRLGCFDRKHRLLPVDWEKLLTGDG